MLCQLTKVYFDYPSWLGNAGIGIFLVSFRIRIFLTNYNPTAWFFPIPFTDFFPPFVLFRKLPANICKRKARCSFRFFFLFFIIYIYPLWKFKICEKVISVNIFEKIEYIILSCLFLYISQKHMPVTHLLTICVNTVLLPFFSDVHLSTLI